MALGSAEAQRDALVTAEQARDKYQALWVEQGRVSRDYRERAEAAEQRATRLAALEAAARAWMTVRADDEQAWAEAEHALEGAIAALDAAPGEA